MERRRAEAEGEIAIRREAWMRRSAEAEREIAIRREQEAQMRRRADQFGRMPEFEWPPPKASARTLLPSKLSQGTKFNSCCAAAIPRSLEA